MQLTAVQLAYIEYTIQASPLPPTTLFPRAPLRVVYRPPSLLPRLRAAPPQRYKSWFGFIPKGGVASHFDRMSGPAEGKQGFLAGLSPWGSRAATPKPPPTPTTAEADKTKKKENEKEKEQEFSAGAPGTQRGGDHVVDRRHRLSLKRYPRDCPPLAVKWFHAVDVSKTARILLKLHLT